MHTIDSLEKSKRSFALEEQWRLQSKGISVNFSPAATVSFGNTECNGYFVDEPKPFLTVATGKDDAEWFPIFVHETCHADQFLEQAPCWTNKIGGIEPMTILDLWLDHHVELNPIQLNNTIRAALEIELDCERRVVAKHEKHNLDFNKEEYIQKANSYVYFYLVMMTTRKWYGSGKAPYKIPEIWKTMPTTFQDDYQYSDHFLELYKPCYDSN